MKIKHYSVLQDRVAKTAFEKGGLLMFQLSTTLVCTVLHTAEQLTCLAFNKYQVRCFFICSLLSKANIN